MISTKIKKITLLTIILSILLVGNNLGIKTIASTACSSKYAESGKVAIIVNLKFNNKRTGNHTLYVCDGSEQKFETQVAAGIQSGSEPGTMVDSKGNPVARVPSKPVTKSSAIRILSIGTDEQEDIVRGEFKLCYANSGSTPYCIHDVAPGKATSSNYSHGCIRIPNNNFNNGILPIIFDKNTYAQRPTIITVGENLF